MWLLEQPGSSCMHFHPLFQQIVKMVSTRKMTINMSDYGAPTKKRTLLFSSASNWITKCFGLFGFGFPFKVFPLMTLAVPAWSGHPAVDHLSEFKVRPNLQAREMVRHYVDGSGQSRICGGRDLKSSQEYPRQCFGFNDMVLFLGLFTKFGMKETHHQFANTPMENTTWKILS